jgi:hypothetical protein
VKLVVLVVGVLIAATLAWNGAELHYRSCIDAAEARTPLGGVKDPYDYTDDPLGIKGDALKDRRGAVDGCSRLPW